MQNYTCAATTQGWMRGFEAHFSRNLQNSLVTIAVVLVATVVGLSLWITQETDRLAHSNSHQMVEGGLEGLQERLLSLTRDYAFWTEFYDAILEKDQDWLYSNVASKEGTEAEISIIIEPNGTSDFGWRSDIEDVAPITGIIRPETLALLHDQLDQVPVTDRNAYSTFARLGGDIWVLAMARVVPWEGIAPETPDTAIPRLVMGKVLTPELLSALGAPFLIHDLELTSQGFNKKTSFALRDATGKVLGYATWSPPRSGRSVLSKIGPPLASVTVVTVALLVFAAWHIIGSARRLERALVDAQDASRAKSEFLSTVSHELRTPVTSIKGSLDLIASGALGTPTEKIARLTTVAKENSDRLAALIEDLLEIQKLETGRLDNHFEPIKVRQAVERAIKLTAPLAGNFQVKIKASDTGNDLYVRADQTRLEQVITNILSNAIKFSHEGGEVLVDVQATEAGVRVSVTDHGVGIPSGARDKVFAPFSQIDSSDTRKVGGTGLGLNIAKRIMEAHSGLINYQSKEGTGSTFFIELDRVAAPA